MVNNYTLDERSADFMVWDTANEIGWDKPYLTIARAAFYTLYGDQGLEDLNSTDEDRWYESRNALAAIRYHARKRQGNLFLPSQHAGKVK